MDYPRTVILEDKKLKAFLFDKKLLLTKGRAISEDIEKKEAEMTQIDENIQAAEKKVDTKDLDEEAKEITMEFNRVAARMEEMKRKVYQRMNSSVDPALKVAYENAKKSKEEMETQRNKVALKIQKINDRVIPIARKLMSPYLENKYEDMETIQLDEEERIVGTIFSHLNDFEKRFDAKAKK